jgi:hypothetical protein
MLKSNQDAPDQQIPGEHQSSSQYIDFLVKAYLAFLFAIPLIFVISVLFSNQKVPPGYWIGIPVLFFWLSFSIYRAYWGLVREEFTLFPSPLIRRLDTRHEISYIVKNSGAKIIGFVWSLFGMCFAIAVVWLLLPYIGLI